MKLIECYIENFGCLQAFSYQFNQELTTINEMNGWGKSTFGAFLRAMFYGMPQTKKSNLAENDRVKYTPWNGNRMGGNIVFQVKGKQYKLERFFEKKEKEDVFVLYEQPSNMESKDFSENLGEEIFGIDLDAYAKSAYISQNSIEIGTNDSINAKLGNLLDSDNDINNFDQAIKRLKDAKKEYKKTGKRGRIGQLENEIAEMKIALEKMDPKRQALEEREEQKNEIRRRKEAFQMELTQVKKEVGKAAAYEGRAQKKKQYENCKVELEEKLQETNELLLFFKEELPTEEELTIVKEQISKLEQERGKQDSYEWTREEKENVSLFEDRISEGFFSEETLHLMENRGRRIRDLEVKIGQVKLTTEELALKNHLDEFFAKNEAPERDLTKANMQITEIQRLDMDIAEKEEEGELEPTEIEKAKSPFGTILMIFAILFMLAGTILFMTPFSSLAFIGIGIGFVFFGIYLALAASFRKKHQQQVEESAGARKKQEESLAFLQEKRLEILDDLNGFFNQFVGLNQEESHIERLMRVRDQKASYLALQDKDKKAEVESYEEEIKEEAARLSHFFKRMKEDISNVVSWDDGLQSIRASYNAFLLQRKKGEQARENKKIIEGLEDEINAFMVNFRLDEREDYFSALEEIRKQVERLNYMHKDARKVKAQIQAFEQMEDFSLWKELEEKDLNVEDLRNRESRLENLKEEEREKEKQIQKHIDLLLIELDELKDMDQDKIFLEEELNKNKSKLEIIEDTITYLEEAKNLFSSHYLKGLRQAFEKYTDKIGDEKVRGAKLDAEMEVKIEKNGVMRKLDYFSRGSQDLINVCARFALVDALFEEEKPFLILDDTFVNFDEEKLEKALDLLNEIAKDYQIVYLVCHDSRVRP